MSRYVVVTKPLKAFVLIAMCTLLAAPVEYVPHEAERDFSGGYHDSDPRSGVEKLGDLLQATFGHTYVPFDGSRFDNSDEAEVVGRYIDSSPVLSRLSFARWDWSKHDFKPVDIVRLSYLMAQDVPGTTPELVDFLHPVAFMGALADINRAWNGRHRSEMPFRRSDVDTFFQSRSGQTIILVGHIEGSDFVMRDNLSQVIGSLNVSELLEKAKQHHVLLLPIGCKSSHAHAPIGFDGNISTDDVVSFIKALPTGPSKIIDIVAAMNVFERVRIHTVAAQNWLSVLVETEDSNLNLGSEQVPDPTSIATLQLGSETASTPKPTPFTQFNLPWPGTLQPESQSAYLSCIKRMQRTIAERRAFPLWIDLLIAWALFTTTMSATQNLMARAKKIQGIRSERRFATFYTAINRLENISRLLANGGKKIGIALLWVVTVLLVPCVIGYAFGFWFGFLLLYMAFKVWHDR